MRGRESLRSQIRLFVPTLVGQSYVPRYPTYVLFAPSSSTPVLLLPLLTPTLDPPAGSSSWEEISLSFYPLLKTGVDLSDASTLRKNSCPFPSFRYTSPPTLPRHVLKCITGESPVTVLPGVTPICKSENARSREGGVGGPTTRAPGSWRGTINEKHYTNEVWLKCGGTPEAGRDSAPGGVVVGWAHTCAPEYV